MAATDPLLSAASAGAGAGAGARSKRQYVFSGELVRGMQFYGYCEQESVFVRMSVPCARHLTPQRLRTSQTLPSASATYIARTTSRAWLACCMAGKWAERNRTACSNHTTRTSPTTCSSCATTTWSAWASSQVPHHRNRPACSIHPKLLPSQQCPAPCSARLCQTRSPSARQTPRPPAPAPLPSCGMRALCRQTRVHRVQYSGEKLACLQLHVAAHCAMW